MGSPDKTATHLRLIFNRFSAKQKASEVVVSARSSVEPLLERFRIQHFMHYMCMCLSDFSLSCPVAIRALEA